MKAKVRKMICFDMDGTIADLYGVPNWLQKLRNEDTSPYADAAPMVDMEKLNAVCDLSRQAGYEIQVITALAKNASPEYKKAIRQAKKEWLEKWGFIYDHFHGVDYKRPKKEVIRRDMRCNKNGFAVLVDDETRHTSRWNWGKTIDPTTENIIEALREMLKGGE